MNLVLCLLCIMFTCMAIKEFEFEFEFDAWSMIQYKDAILSYRKSHCGDKTILPPSYLDNGISNAGKIKSLY